MPAALLGPGITEQSRTPTMLAVRTLAVDELREVRDDGAWIVHVISGVETEVLPRVWSARSVIGVNSVVERQGSQHRNQCPLVPPTTHARQQVSNRLRARLEQHGYGGLHAVWYTCMQTVKCRHLGGSGKLNGGAFGLA